MKGKGFLKLMKKIEEMTVEELIGKGDYYAKLADMSEVMRDAVICASMASMYYNSALVLAT